MPANLSRLSRAAAACAALALCALAARGQTPPAAAASYLLVLNKAEATLAIVDPATMQVVGRVPTGEGPHEVAVSSDGRTAYVTNYGAQKPGNSISVIDLASRRETKRVDLGPLLRPHGIVERGGKIYFTAELARAVARYDPAADKVDLIVGTGQSITHMLVMHPKRAVVYTADILSNTATVIELEKQQQTPGPPPHVSHVAVGPQPEGIDITPDGRELWVGHNQDGGISVIDTETLKVTETIKAGGMPIRIKFTPDGRYALVSSPPTGELTVFDAATRKEVKRLRISEPPQAEGGAGQVPIGILIAPDGRRAYVAVTTVGRPDPGKVVRVDLEKLEAAGSVETGRGPDGLGWAGK
ncbi:MAG TPA: cytochrome D1 domain-containing protein [Pyrinomonadaceae bacterium]|nr:cytochrome D1 domain-containing protein [Pyrinomonadaceae bacterium]